MRKPSKYQPLADAIVALLEHRGDRTFSEIHTWFECDFRFADAAIQLARRQGKIRTTKGKGGPVRWTVA